jgi:hypothetical protein
MQNIVSHIDFQGADVPIRVDGWFNATAIAAKYDREPIQWLRQLDAAEYISALAMANGNSASKAQLNEIKELRSNSGAFQKRIVGLAIASGYVKTARGSMANGGGTWLHPKLAIVFGRWPNADFAVWLDMKIDAILRGRGSEFLAVSMEFRQEKGKASDHGRGLNRWRCIKPILELRLQETHPQLGFQFYG